MLEVRLLGQFDVRLDGEPIAISSRPAQSLLAYLILNAGAAHRREKLAGLLWPDSAETNARSNLRHILWRLRQAIPSDYFLVDDLTIAFNAGLDFWLDTAVLAHAPLSSSDELMDALTLYRGELLPGFYHDWVIPERERVRAIFEQKMKHLLDGLVAGQRWTAVLDWAEHWIALGETPEPAYRALMRAYAGLGDLGTVTAVYRRCEQALRQNLDVEPSERTRIVYKRLLSGPSPHNLPNQLTSFIGRQWETAELQQHLANHRLLTLTGAGGVGKTRLALHVATGARDAGVFPDGVWLVELASLSDPTHLAQTVAATLSMYEESDRPLLATLTDYLRSRRLLLVLDNCEHLLAACAALIQALLHACPALSMMTTSREAINIPGEHLFHVPPLAHPDLAWVGIQTIVDPSDLLQYEAVRLFRERATAALPGFALTSQNAFPVAQVCHRLDGIPLAIELAAARVNLLRVEEIAVRLNDLFRLLTNGSRAALPRQQTLRATIDWSHDLLSSAERALFRRLAVFAGGWALAAATAVCGLKDEGGSARPEPAEGRKDELPLLAALVKKSLVMAERKPGEEARYRLLETMRQYAREKLLEAGEETEIRDRHLGYFLQSAERAQSGLRGPEQARWLAWLEAEHDNLRAALAWAAEHNPEASLRLAGALGTSFYMRALARLDTATIHQTQKRAKTLDGAGLLAWAQGDYPLARSLHEESLSLYQQMADETGIIHCLIGLARAAVAEEAWETAVRLLAEAGQLRQSTNALLSTAGRIEYERLAAAVSSQNMVD